MIIRWNEYVLRQAIVQPNLIHFKDWIDNYAEACEDLSTSQRPTNQENSSSRRSNRLFQQQSNERCLLCGYSHNLGKCNQLLNKDINERQQTVRQLKICPNCLTEHPKGQCNSHYRCRIENCNGFHHSTIHRNNFNSSQTYSPNQQQQSNQQQQYQQQTHNQVQNHSANNYHNNRDQQNNGHQTQITAKRSQFQPHGFNYGRVVGYNQNNNTRNAFCQNNNTNRFNQIYNFNNKGSTFKRNYNNPNNFMLNTNSRQQNTRHSHNQTDTQNQSQRQQNFNNNNNNSNPRPQNHTCSKNQISSWIRPQV